MDLTERVARALCKAQSLRADAISAAWGGVPQFRSVPIQRDAAVAIAAVFDHLQEPSEAMVEVGDQAHFNKRNDMTCIAPTEHPDAGGGPFGYAWRAMLSQARREAIGE